MLQNAFIALSSSHDNQISEIVLALLRHSALTFYPISLYGSVLSLVTFCGKAQCMVGAGQLGEFPNGKIYYAVEFQKAIENAAAERT